MKKIIILFITFTSLSYLSAAESSQKQQVLEWTTAELEAKTFPPIPKPRMVPTLQSLSTIAFENAFGKIEESESHIKNFVQENNIEQVSLFLSEAQKRFDKDVLSNFLIDLLCIAQSEEVKALIISSPAFNVNITSAPMNGTRLHDACSVNESEISTLLIEAHANVNAKALHGLCPLHICDNVESVKLLIESGADVNAQEDLNGGTPLHVYNESPEIVQLLIEARANVNAKDKYGRTPLHVYKNPTSVSLLIAANADVNAKDNLGRTPLEIHLNNAKIIQLLIEAGADVKAQDEFGKTLLHHTNSIEVAQLLIAAGVSPCIPDRSRALPHQNSFGNRQKVVCNYLKQEYDKQMTLMKIHK